MRGREGGKRGRREKRGLGGGRGEEKREGGKKKKKIARAKGGRRGDGRREVRGREGERPTPPPPVHPS